MDKISIYNQALARVGISAGLTGENDPSPELTICNRMFDAALADVLTACPWRCVRKTAQLAALEENPRPDYLYAFPLPADFLAAIPELAPRGRWEIAGSNYYSDYSEVLFFYTAKPDNVSALASHVVEALVLKLALKIAPPLKVDLNLQQALLTEYERVTLPQALSKETRESFVARPRRSWVDPRGGF